MSRLTLVMFGLLWGMPQSVLGEIYLLSEEILAKKSKFKIGWETMYATASRANTIVVVSNDGPVPKDHSVMTDQVATRLGVRYGIADDIELSVNGDFGKTWVRYALGGEEYKGESWDGMNAVSFGLSYQVNRDNVFPAVALFSAIKVIQWDIVPGADPSARSRVYFRGGSIGGVVYRTVDPIVLALSANYAIEIERRFGDLRVDPSNVFSVQPSVYFIVNNEVSLNFSHGISASRLWNYEKQVSGAMIVRNKFSVGLTYEVFKDVVLGVTSELQIVEPTHPAIGLNLLYDL